VTERVAASRTVGEAVVMALQGDLTAQAVDAVVNAANEQLSHGGGVAAALAKAGGPDVQRESDAWVAEHGEVGPGTAAVTTAGRMSARWVIHVVGPRWHDGQDNEGLLRQAVQAALGQARELGAGSVAFPAISAGIFGYPRDQATAVIAGEIVAWLAADPGSVSEVRLVGFDADTTQEFADGLAAA
jgi:O-acetyl-ADP-ribose deacetylase (regulator of RNase III)